MVNPSSSGKLQSGLLATIVEYTLLTLLMISVPLVVAVDVIVLNHGVHETSVTEFAQEGLLFVSMILMLLTARKRPEARGFLVLVAGLFGTMLVREADVFLDEISQGFWVYPALLVSAGAIIYSIRLRSNIITPLVDYSATKGFIYLMIGLLIVLVFSRGFGTSMLWSEVMGDDYVRTYKSVIQEGVELLGYALVCFGSIHIFIQTDSTRTSDGPDQEQ